MGGSIRKSVWVGAALLLAGLGGASAQMMGGMMSPGMMSPGYGYGMMGPGYGMVSPGYDYGMMGYDPVERLRVALNLNDSQVTQLRNLWLEHVRTTTQTQAGLQMAQMELQNMQAVRTANPSQVENQIRQIANQWANLQLAQTRFQQQLRNVLTPQQSDRLNYYQRFGMHGIPFGYGWYGMYGTIPDAGYPQQPQQPGQTGQQGSGQQPAQQGQK